VTPYTRDGLRPEVQAFIAAARAARVPGAPRDAAASRAFDPVLATVFGAGSPDVAREEEIRIPILGGEVRALVYAPEQRDGELLPVVQYTHGGGFVIMTPESVAKVAKRIANDARAVVVSIDYRRAPEYPYPAPLDDCVDAFRWLRMHAATLGGDASRIATAGESAGGNLAAATALRLDSAGEPMPTAVVVACGWMDLAMQTRSLEAFGPDDPIIDSEVLRYWRSCYTPDEALWREPFASPLRGDLSSFPPSCVVPAGIDPLYDDNVLFADALRRAGREVEVHDYEGMPHDFLLFPQLEPLTDVMARITTFLRRALHDRD
jgi:acetyl esterase/lipase